MPENSPTQPAPDSVARPDIDLRAPTQRHEWSSHRWLLPVIALGGIAGTTVRYLLSTAYPTPHSGFPWTTFAINATGCFLIGVLMVFVVDAGGAHPLVRPFLGVGVLGGYTTFSTYAVETMTLLTGGRPTPAAAYLLATPVTALVAVTLAAVATRSALALRLRHTQRTHHGGQR